jgi:hypothetical protein
MSVTMYFKLLNYTLSQLFGVVTGVIECTSFCILS